MPAGETIFEIHACAKGHWRTLGTFEDANDAIAEAMRLRRTLKYSGIRVTAESYQDSSGKFARRVVYRYSHETRPPAAVADWHPAAAGPSVRCAPVAPSESEAADPLVDLEFLRMIAVRLGFVILAAIVTLWVLRAG